MVLVLVQLQGYMKLDEIKKEFRSFKLHEDKLHKEVVPNNKNIYHIKILKKQ